MRERTFVPASWANEPAAASPLSPADGPIAVLLASQRRVASRSTPSAHGDRVAFVSTEDVGHCRERERARGRGARRASAPKAAAQGGRDVASAASSLARPTLERRSGDARRSTSPAVGLPADVVRHALALGRVMGRSRRRARASRVGRRWGERRRRAIVRGHARICQETGPRRATERGKAARRTCCDYDSRAYPGPRGASSSAPAARSTTTATGVANEPGGSGARATREGDDGVSAARFGTRGT